jgi:hypothetical protein
MRNLGQFLRPQDIEIFLAKKLRLIRELEEKIIEQQNLLEEETIRSMDLLFEIEDLKKRIEELEGQRP